MSPLRLPGLRAGPLLHTPFVYIVLVAENEPPALRPVLLDARDAVLGHVRPIPLVNAWVLPDGPAEAVVGANRPLADRLPERLDDVVVPVVGPERVALDTVLQ